MSYPRHGTPIYRTPRWKALRLQALRRDNFRCVDCGSAGRLEVDHVTPLRAGGAPYDLENTACRCVPCHSRKTRLEIGLGKIDPAREAWKSLLSKGLPLCSNP